MNLYDEEEVRYQKERNRKIKKYVLIGITFTVVLIAVLTIVIYLLIQNPNKITIKVNGKEDLKLESIITTEISQTDDSKIFYMPIREFAAFSDYWQYNSFDGEGPYGADYESKDSCYIISEKEVVLFNVNSKTIYKIDLEQQKSSNNSDYEYEEIKLENPIISKNDKLYIDLDGIEKAFNTIISYNAKTKTIAISTLDTYVASAESVATQSGYKKLDEAFINQRAVLSNRIVVENEEGAKGIIVYSNENSTGKTSGQEIRGAQYKEIKYVPQKQVFIVKGANEKVGIVDINGEQKIDLSYDSLLLIDEENDLYLAQNGAYYGVIDANGNTVIYLEYGKIGVDASQFKKNGLKNGYVLLGKLIPVQQNEKWGFYSIEKDKTTGAIVSKQLPDMNYDGIGCITKANGGVVANIMVMQDYELVVVQKNGLYGFIAIDGVEAVPIRLTDLYMETSSGQTNYYMVYNNRTLNMLELFEKNHITKKQ